MGDLQTIEDPSSITSSTVVSYTCGTSHGRTTGKLAWVNQAVHWSRTIWTGTWDKDRETMLCGGTQFKNIVKVATISLAVTRRSSNDAVNSQKKQGKRALHYAIFNFGLSKRLLMTQGINVTSCKPGSFLYPAGSFSISSISSFLAFHNMLISCYSARVAQTHA
jgi:hypothetical protein